MAQTLRDWYRYLERQMHVSLPAEPPNGPPDPEQHPREAGRSRDTRAAPATTPIPADSAEPAGAGIPHPGARAAVMRGRLPSVEQQSPLPMDLGPRARGRGGRRPITETREEIIRRVLDPELTLHEAAAVLNLSKATVRRYTDQGRLPCLRTGGGQRRFRLSALLTFLEQQAQARGEA